MPHVILEYSSNVVETGPLNHLMSCLHHVLTESAGAQAANCKSRAYVADDYWIANGRSKEAFVHATISILEGRSAEIKQSVGNQCLEILQEWFNDSLANLELQISVEIRDMAKNSYFKLA